jgi:hypothetical protein
MSVKLPAIISNTWLPRITDIVTYTPVFVPMQILVDQSFMKFRQRLQPLMLMDLQVSQPQCPVALQVALEVPAQLLTAVAAPAAQAPVVAAQA